MEDEIAGIVVNTCCAFVHGSCGGTSSHHDGTIQHPFIRSCMPSSVFWFVGWFIRAFMFYQFLPPDLVSTYLLCCGARHATHNVDVLPFLPGWIQPVGLGPEDITPELNSKDQHVLQVHLRLQLSLESF